MIGGWQQHTQTLGCGWGSTVDGQQAEAEVSPPTLTYLTFLTGYNTGVKKERGGGVLYYYIPILKLGGLSGIGGAGVVIPTPNTI